MRLLVDMNLSPGRVGFLQQAGFKAIHWSTVGSPDGRGQNGREVELVGHDNMIVGCRPLHNAWSEAGGGAQRHPASR
jgi:hypothetical protein